MIASYLLLAETPPTTQQLAARVEIELAKLTEAPWCETSVKTILRQHPREVVERIMCDHMLHSGIFVAGQQVAKWCSDLLQIDDILVAIGCCLRQVVKEHET